MKAASRWFLNNLGLILLSLALSLIVWAAAMQEDNPTTVARYSSRIPVAIPAPPEGMVAYGDTDVQVYVTLRAPQSVWQALRQEDIHATVSLDGLDVGTHRLPVRVEVAQRPARVEQVEPEAIVIHLEPAETVTVPVRASIEGDTAIGYVSRTSEAHPTIVMASGPASFVAQVSEAVARISVEGERADVRAEFQLEPQDADGNIVPYVTLSPASATIHVPIEQLRGFRDLGVTAPLSGTVAPGYRIANITVDPPVVTVFGGQEAIERIPGQLSTDPLNIEGAREDVEMDLPLLLPEGVSLVGMDSPLVTVRVAVVPQVGSVTVQRTVEIQRLSASITATVAPTMAQVVLSGPVPMLEQLQEGDVQIIVDLFEMGPGSYSITPLIVKPADITVESILPASIQVEISTAPTPGPRR